MPKNSLFLLLFLYTRSLYAAGDAGQPGSFLRQEVGARGMALAGALGALVEDPTAVFWNPAALSSLPKPELSMTHILLFEDTLYDFLGLGLPSKTWGGFGLGILKQSSGKFEKRTNPFDPPTSFSITDTAWLFSWAGPPLPLPFPAQVGATLKGVRQEIDNVSGQGWGMDLGLRLRPHPRWILGSLLQNLAAPRLTLVSQTLTYPVGLDLSSAYIYPLAKDLQAAGAVHFSKVGSQRLKPGGGVEISYGTLLSARWGVQEKGFSTGIGFRWGNTHLDYAVLLHDLGLSHHISLGLQFGQTREELEETIRKGMTRLSREEAQRLAASYLLQAENYMREGKYAQALHSLEAASLWEPADPSLAQKIHRIRSQIENIIRTQLTERTLLLGIHQMEQGNLPSSWGYFREVLEIDPENTQAAYYLKRIKERWGLHAQQEWEKERLATLSHLVQSGKYKEAIRQMEQMRKLSPQDPQLFSLLQSAREKLRFSLSSRIEEGKKAVASRNWSQALKIFEEALREDPKNPEAKRSLEQVRTQLSQPLSEENRKRVEQLYYQAVDHYLKGDYARSQEFLQQLFQTDPFNPEGKKLQEKIQAATQVGPP